MSILESGDAQLCARLGNSIITRNQRMRGKGPMMVCWGKLIPRVLREYHAMQGVRCLPPYVIVYGRQCPFAASPCEAPRVSQDAADFVHQIQCLEAKVAKHLEEEHLAWCDLTNPENENPPLSAVGSKCGSEEQPISSLGCTMCREDKGSC